MQTTASTPQNDRADGKEALQASSTYVGNAFYRRLAVTHPDHCFFEDVKRHQDR
jgi:hypothetical protein